MYTYLVINILTIVFPVIFSFEKQMQFYKKWVHLWPSLLIVAGLFLVWDHYFTIWGIWRFNPAFVMGYYLFSLPIEEWMFFITIPYSCMFVYETVRFYNWFTIPKTISLFLLFGFILGCGIMAVLFQEKLYTSVTFALAAMSLVIFWIKFKDKYLSLFWITFFIQLAPFLIVNGVLTSWPVLIYNDTENLGIRIGTIPLEDAFYSLIMLTLNITLYEWLYTRFVPKSEIRHA